MGGKRKHGELALRYDAKLMAVTRALNRLTRLEKSADLTSGAFSEYPLPGLRLDGDASDLPLPLPPEAADAIVQKTANTKSDKLTWEIQSQGIHVRNRRWEAFINKIVGAICEPLGISRAASVEASLHKLVLVREGGRFPVGTAMHSMTHKRGSFGTLIVVLPSEFTGGEVAVSDLSTDAAKPRMQWNPHSTDAYDITYAAFYDSSSDKCKAHPVMSGDALCLVYDLVTSTIDEVPRLAGESALQRALEASLTLFFEVLPSNKRFKISDDAWRTINEFVVKHRFVYPVRRKSFERLRGKDQRVADRLAAFCTHSNGQYVLYIAELNCTRKSYSREEDADDTQADFTIHLDSPWRKHGGSERFYFPESAVDHLVELAPAGFVETAKYESDEEEEEDDDDDDQGFIYGYHDYNEDNYRKTRRHNCFALVVLPVTLEQTLWAEMPIANAMAKVQKLMQTRPDDAYRLARRMVATHRLTYTDAPDFKKLLALVQSLNDAPLFGDLLANVTSFEFENGSLSSAVSHFGWDSCITAIKRFIQTTSFRSRVNLVCSVLHDSTDHDHIKQLIQQLISVQPWSGGPAPPRRYPAYACIRYVAHPNPSVEEFSRLFSIAYRASMNTLMKLLAVETSRLFRFELTVPALARFAGELSIVERSPLVSLLRSMHDTIESLLPELRNASYAACTIPDHCDKCRELQAFLLSPAPFISLRLRDKAHLKHMETVVKRKVSHSGMVSITLAPPNIVLTKKSMRNEYSVAAEQCLASLTSLII